VKAFTHILLILFVAGSISTYAQRRLKNQPTYDQRKLHFGFSLGVNYYDFKVDEIRNLNELTGYYNVTTEVEPGYTILIISNLRLGDNSDLRFTPGFASTVRRINFEILDPRTETLVTERRQIESSFLEFPVEFKYKSDRVDNYRLYVLGGLKYSLDLASDQDVDDDRVFKITEDNYAYELAFGIDIYFEYFKFSPQIRASFGFTNSRVGDGTFLVQGINTLQTRALLINFTFE
jgi:hypothetical protein